MLVNNRATLLYLTQLGNIEEHAWLAPARDLHHPDWVVFDLDPGKAEFGTVCEVALALHQVLNGLGLKSYAKTSSAGGLARLCAHRTTLRLRRDRRFRRADRHAPGPVHPCRRR